MPTSVEYLLANNREQTVSEVDDFTAERYRQMFRELPPGATKILDAGCNTGRGGVILNKLNPALEIFGLDCIPERIERLDPAVYVRGFCGYSTHVPVPEQTFDAIVGGEFIEHVPPGEIDPTLAEFFRVLKLRGRLILTTPNPNYVKNRLRGLSVLLERSHVSQHYPDCLRHRLRSNGYSRVAVRGSGRMTRWIGARFPWLAFYGSYLVRADKW